MGAIRYFSGSMLGTEFKGIVISSGLHRAAGHASYGLRGVCWAMGVEQRFLDQVRRVLARAKPVEGYLHDIMMRNYRAYIVAGGMPEVVQKYVDSGYSLAETRAMQTLLVRQYAQDIGNMRVIALSRSVRFSIKSPCSLKAAHRFKLSSLRDAARMSRSITISCGW